MGVPCGAANSKAAAPSSKAAASGSESNHPEYTASGVASAKMPAAASDIVGAIPSRRKMHSASAAASAEKNAAPPVRKKLLTTTFIPGGTPGRCFATNCPATYQGSMASACPGG